MEFFNTDTGRFIKFGFVGVLNTLINWIIFIVLNSHGVYYIFSNIIAYTIATLNSYIWNSKWVFKYNGENQKQTSVKFIVLNIFGLGLNTIILYILVDIFGIAKIIALILATAIIMLINYILNKIWVFRSK